jgi:hypothetical protein
VSSEHKNVAYDDKYVVPQIVACVHMALEVECMIIIEASSET